MLKIQSSGTVLLDSCSKNIVNDAFNVAEI